VLLVAGMFTVQPNSRINADGSPQDLRVQVAGTGKSAVNISGGVPSQIVFPSGGTAASSAAPRGASTCTFRPRLFGAPPTTVVTPLCAPGKKGEGHNATLNLFNALIFGTFVADEIEVANVSGGTTPPSTTTSTSTTTTTSSTTTTTTSTSTTTTSRATTTT